MKYILIALLVIAFVPPVRRFVFYLLVGRKLAKEQERFNNRQQAARPQPGETRVSSVPPSYNKANNTDGEYVPYEEVK